MSGPTLVITPALDLEAARSGDLLTLSFADQHNGVYGQARVALLPEGGRQTLVAVFHGATAIVAAAVPHGSLQLSPAARGGVRARFDGAEASQRGPGAPGREAGDGAFDLELAPSGPAAMLGDPEHGAGGAGAQQLGSVSGTVRVGGREIAVAGGGQVGLVRGAADWSQRTLWREIDCWLDDADAVTVRASRPAGTSEHAAELSSAVLLAGEPPVAAVIDEARISTVYGHDGRPLRAGLELWPSADSDYPRRIAGHTLAAATVTPEGPGVPGRPGGPGGPGGHSATSLVWHCAFLHWHMEGEEGVGPYSIVRRGG